PRRQQTNAHRAVARRGGHWARVGGASRAHRVGRGSRGRRPRLRGRGPLVRRRAAKIARPPPPRSAREAAGRPRGSPRPLHGPGSHGARASGLALSRAATLTPDRAEPWCPTVAAAATSAASWLALHARDRAMDVTPCHGLAGVTEFLTAAGHEHDYLVARVWR